MASQHDNAATFRVLHERETPFLLPNPWDAGSARLLAHLDRIQNYGKELRGQYT